MRRVIELAPVVFAEAADDAVAAEIVDRLAAEVVTLARVALERLDLTQEPVEVMLGGGLFRTRDERLLAAIAARPRRSRPGAHRAGRPTRRRSSARRSSASMRSEPTRRHTCACATSSARPSSASRPSLRRDGAGILADAYLEVE